MKIQVDASELSWGALMDLETAVKTVDIANWLVEHAGADMQDLRALPASEITDIAEQVGALLRDALSVPKAKGRRSS